MKSYLLSRLLLPLTLLFTGASYARDLPEFTQLVKANSAAVVNISTTQKRVASRSMSQQFDFPDLPEDSPFRDFFDRLFKERPGLDVDPIPAHSLGSGFIISADGYILTNAHVVRDAEKIIVKLNDQTEKEAKVIGADKRTDLAVLKVEGSSYSPVHIGNSDKLEVGEWVIAIGSPFGLESTATAGIVSAISRALPSDAYVPFIQTDAAVNPGNSGGPLFNTDGEVVGINSQIYSRTGGYMGLSFAIPINIAMQVADQIKSHGHASHGWLGVLIQPVTPELAQSFGLDRSHGALVSKVIAGSPAEKAGIQPGDVIVRYDNKPIDRSSDLPPLVGSTASGVSLPVEALRNGKPKEFNIKIEELTQDQEEQMFGDEDESEPSEPKAPPTVMGMVLEDLTPADRAKKDLKQGGVRVTAVTGEPAAGAGVRRGDVILKLNNEDVQNADSLREKLKQLPDGKPSSLLLQRGDSPLFLAITPPAAAAGKSE